MPVVSVIIPNYNHAAFLRQRIDSILNQSFQDLEIIILDDCSTDNSREVIETYRNQPKVTQLIYNKNNSGSPFLQWEKGINLAQGKYIWIAESDDWCEPTLLEELFSGISENEDCAISYCQSYCIAGTREISWISHHPFLSEYFSGEDFIRKYMVKNNTIFNASMVLWKKELFTGISKEFLTYKFCGDWLFWIEIAKKGQVHVSGKILNYFRKHDRDVTGKAAKNGLSYLEPLRILHNLYQQQFINRKAYDKVLKIHFKRYWSERALLDPSRSKEINTGFKTAISSKTSYIKMLMSAIWMKRKRN